jgi:hypothetical protein
MNDNTKETNNKTRTIIVSEYESGKLLIFRDILTDDPEAWVEERFKMSNVEWFLPKEIVEDADASDYPARWGDDE